jgi:predicted permease
MQDLQFALRMMRRQPWYTALVVATMALGIAATAVLSSVAYGVLLKPLPWADAPRLVRLSETRQGSTKRLPDLFTNRAYLAWRDKASTIDTFGAWSTNEQTLTNAGEAERIRTVGVTPSLLTLLQAQPLRGRLFVDGDERPGQPPIAIISYGLWQQRLGGQDPVGRTIVLDGTPHTIVGVLPSAFMFPDADTRVWTPFYVKPTTDPAQPGSTSVQLLRAVGRLRPGVTPAQAAAEGTARAAVSGETGSAAAVAMAVFGSTGPVQISAVPLLDALTADVRPAIVVLFVAVILLLVTATANVAGLQLARAAGRRRELAVRAALGAGAGRLMRQTLVENVLLGAVGGAAGLVLAAVMQRALPSLLPAGFPRVDDVTLNARVQLFAMGISLAAGLGFGLLPALQASRRELVAALNEDSLAPVGGSLRTRTARTRAAIMSLQVAVACVLLVGATLLIRSFVGLLNADTGYKPAGVLTATITMPDANYTPERRRQVADRIVDRMRAVPGVTNAAYGVTLPFSGRIALSSFPLKKHDGSTIQVQTGVRAVSPGYFAALGQRVVEGREFAASDTSTAQAVAMVNREFARRYLDGKALGWALPANKGDRTIVGVAENAIRQSVTDTPQPEIYMPATQGMNLDSCAFVIRTGGDPRALASMLRTAVREQDSQVPLEGVATLEDLVSRSVARPRLYAVVLGTFAAFALAIAGVGLFGVLSYTVAQRTREIGVRTALGAGARDIITLVAGQALRIGIAGVAAGLLLSFWMARALQSFLYGVTAHDPLAFGAAAAILIAVALVAAVMPARRAAGVDPVRVLRDP